LLLARISGQGMGVPIPRAGRRDGNVLASVFTWGSFAPRFGTKQSSNDLYQLVLSRRSALPAFPLPATLSTQTYG